MCSLLNDDMNMPAETFLSTPNINTMISVCFEKTYIKYYILESSKFTKLFQAEDKDAR